MPAGWEWLIIYPGLFVLGVLLLLMDLLLLGVVALGLVTAAEWLIRTGRQAITAMWSLSRREQP